MPEQKPFIPYKVQKGNRPKIEEVITSCLDGALQTAALDFATFMRESISPFKLHTSTTRSQRADYNGYEICSIIVHGDDSWKYCNGYKEGDPLL